MKDNTAGEIHIGSEGEVYNKYINHHVCRDTLQPMFPPKPFDCSGGFLAAFRFFLNKKSKE